jgi:membrane-associated phospholipid phosphatase
MGNRLPQPFVVLLFGSLLVVACYFFVDRQVAWFMYEHRVCAGSVAAWAPRISDWLTYVVIAGMLPLAIWRIWRPGGPLQSLLVAIAANLIVTTAIKSFLKGVFGRTWPESWLGNNPSLIRDDVYGFYPLHFAHAYGSFPSGHAAATFAVISILWLARPRWRWICAFVGGAICASLVVLNFHFVGDVIAGATLGWVTGYCMARLFRLKANGLWRKGSDSRMIGV